MGRVGTYPMIMRYNSDKRYLESAQEIIKNTWGDICSRDFYNDVDVLERNNILLVKTNENGLVSGCVVVVSPRMDYSVWGIAWLAVRDPERKKGIGTSLVRAAENYISGNRYMYPTKSCLIQLITDNPDFYNKLGYSMAIGFGYNKAIMIKDISGMILKDPVNVL
jgi:GNAT superfamily N-acetyltransferase